MENDVPADIHFTDFEDAACVPECPDKLKPFVGKKFTLKRGIKSSRECVTWQYILCNRQGLKNGIEMDHIHAREGFINKRRRTSKRCDCKARISLRLEGF